MVRGAWGTLLQRISPPEVYERLFEPGNGRTGGPSGLADWPRPFVFRTAELDGATIEPGGRFHFDAHVFELQQPVLGYFETAFAELASAGIGPGRGRARLEGVEQLDVNGRARGDEEPCSVSLDAERFAIDTIGVRFVTPTELKAGGRLTERPEFPALFARLRDRICTLRSRYGRGALELDYRGLGERASRITLGRCELRWESSRRTSSRTGQTHPLGGFLGDAEYQGALAEFAPWLRAARWVGVGRQAVWGKGDLRVIEERRGSPDVNFR